MKAACGTVFKYGDNVDTDVIIPARYLNSSDPKELAGHCMEDIDKDFVKNVKPGDIMVATKNFGCGSSREHAPISIKAAGISCVIAETFARIFYRNAINIGLPIVECKEAANEIEAGDVVEVGEGVTKVKVGDRVSGAPLLPCMKCDDCQQGNFSLCKHYSFIGSRQQGSNADYVVVPEQNAVPFDKSVSYEQGAMFEPATVAIHGVFQNDYHGGEYVAILGGGTVGMFTMQWTKIFGSKKVVVFDISDERLELAKRLGADEVINTKEEGYMEKAMAITGGKGYGFVFETAGQVPTMHMAFELAANKAHVCFIGTPHENLTFTPAQWENMNRKEFKLTGSWMSYSAPYPGREWDLTAHYFATGQLKFDPGFVYKKIPMSQAQEAFQLFKTPGLVKGKILLSNEED